MTELLAIAAGLFLIGITIYNAVDLIIYTRSLAIRERDENHE